MIGQDIAIAIYNSGEKRFLNKYVWTKKQATGKNN